MRLETARLSLFPLTYEQLGLYLRADGSLERSLGLVPRARPIPAALVEAFRDDILPAMLADPANAPFATLWTIVERDAGRAVGDLCFKGPPNGDGEVEVGYGTYDEFRNRGFMSEALGAVCAWALAQPGVRAVAAETETDNAPSRRALEKNGFAPVGAADGRMRWRLDRPAVTAPGAPR